MLELPYLKTVFNTQFLNKKTDVDGQIAQKIENNFTGYLAKANGSLTFKKFLPLMVANNSKIIWYSLVSRTEKFTACQFNEEPKIDFFVEQSSPLFTPILGIDVLDGVQCDDGNCYYKTIRLIAAGAECSRTSSDVGTGNFAECSMINNTILQQGYYYPVYSNVKIHYTISCCVKGLCTHKANFTLRKF